jgi:hypothetical protein
LWKEKKKVVYTLVIIGLVVYIYLRESWSTWVRN